jgi:hypothetical protein
MPSTFTLPTPEAGKELTIIDFATSQAQIQAAIRALQDASPSSGSVTSVAEVDSDTNADFLNVNITNPTTAPVITFTKVATAANLIYASAVSVGSAKPTMRAMVAADLPTVPYGKGGNGLTTIGGAYQMLRVNSAGNANEWFTMVAASGDKITLTPSSGTPNKLTIDVDPTKIEIDTLAATTKLSIAKGGTGASTAQTAINALAAVGTVTNRTKVLTVDGSDNAVWASPSVGIVTLNGLTGATVTLGADNIVAGATNKWYTATEIAEMAANTAKVTNATHTGDVLGSGALTIDKTAITGKTIVSAAQNDSILVSDNSDSGNLKKVLVSTINNTAIKTITTASYTTAVTDRNLFLDPTSTNIVVLTPPDVTSFVGGERFFYKRIAGGANTVKIQVSPKLIDGSSSDISLLYNNSSIEIVYNKLDNFYIVSQIAGTP